MEKRKILKKYFWALESKKLIFRSEILTYPLILKIIRDLKKNTLKILDTGCGTGKLAEMLFTRGFEIYGIDKSKKALEIAKLKNEKICYKVGNVAKLGKEYKKEFFDVVISTFVTLYLNKAQLSKFFNETYKILKKGGLFILVDVHPFLPVVQPKTRWEKWKTKNINYFKSQIINQTIFLPKDSSGIGRIPFPSKWFHHPLFQYLDDGLTARFKLEKLSELKANKIALARYKKMWGEEMRVPVYFILQMKK